MGVLYATWTSTDVWWPRVGFPAGCVSTGTLPTGRVFVVGPNDLRCTMSGAANVGFWTNLLVQQGTTAAAHAVSGLLSQVFGVDVPPPSAVAFKGWPDGVALWSAGVDIPSAKARLSRPWGTDTPVWWASSDLSDYPGWAEGAIQAGQDIAAVLAGT